MEKIISHRKLMQILRKVQTYGKMQNAKSEGRGNISVKHYWMGFDTAMDYVKAEIREVV